MVMIGDGVNDAPVWRGPRVSVAEGGADRFGADPGGSGAFIKRSPEEGRRSGWTLHGSSARIWWSLPIIFVAIPPGIGSRPDGGIACRQFLVARGSQRSCVIQRK